MTDIDRTSQTIHLSGAKWEFIAVVIGSLFISPRHISSFRLELAQGPFRSRSQELASVAGSLSSCEPFVLGLSHSLRFRPVNARTFVRRHIILYLRGPRLCLRTEFSSFQPVLVAFFLFSFGSDTRVGFQALFPRSPGQFCRIFWHIADR